MSLIIRPGNLATGEGDRPILLGFLDLNSSIDSLKHDWYQRRAGFSPVKIRKLVKDMAAGDQMPPVVIGMRGDNFSVDAEETVTLNDQTVIIDGLQRWTAALLAAEEGASIRLGAQVYFNTTEEFEIQLFRKLNSSQTGVAASVLIRNEKHLSRVAGSLFGMSGNQPDFALLNRICWEQRFEPEHHLLTGMTLLHCLITLHTHILRINGYSKALNLLAGADAKIDLVGLQLARENLVRFFDVVDETWGIRGIGVKRGQTHLTQGWLLTCARLFSDFNEFWKDDDKTFFVSAPLMRELKRLDARDEELARLAGGNKNSRLLLYQHFVNRLNKGKVNKMIDRYTKESMREAAE